MLIRHPYISIPANLDETQIYDLYGYNVIPPFKYINVPTEFFWKSFLVNLYGIGKKTIKTWTKILETLVDKPIYELNPFQRYLFFYYYLYLFPYKTSRKKQILYNMNFWYYLYAYKGWRHLFNHPVNGQRTWSNNKTRYRLVNKVYEYQIHRFQKKYGIHTKTNLRISFLAEHINLLWRIEWFSEWLSAYKTFATTKQKTRFFRLRINYRYLMNFQISTPISIERKKKKKNRKKIKTEFTVGFKTLYVVSLFSKKKHLFKHLL